MQIARQIDADLLQLPDNYQSTDSRPILAAIGSELQSTHEATRLEALHWITALLNRSQDEVLAQLEVGSCGGQENSSHCRTPWTVELREEAVEDTRQHAGGA